MNRLIVTILILVYASVGYGQGAWVLSEKQTWMKLSTLYFQSENRFASSNQICGTANCKNGEVTSNYFEGKATSIGLFYDARYGITNKLEFSINIPYYRLKYTDIVDMNRPVTMNFGDVSSKIRYNWLKNKIISTTYVGVKVPTGFYNNDAEVIPVSEGQWDFVLGNQLSTTFAKNVYTNFDIGFRYRALPNPEKTNFAPGSEIPFWLEIGKKMFDKIWWKVSVNGFYGFDGKAILASNSILVRSNSARRIFNIQSGIYYPISEKLFLDFGVNIPAAGKNYPTGGSISLGIAYQSK